MILFDDNHPPPQAGLSSPLLSEGNRLTKPFTGRHVPRTKEENTMGIEQIAKETAERYSYQTADADFEPYGDFKVRWERSGGGHRWISFHISDYVKDAPDDVLRALLIAMLDRICNRDIDENGPIYSIPFLKYITSDGFIEDKRPIWMDRHKIREADRDLTEHALDIPREIGADVEDLVIGYHEGDEDSHLSTIFRVISVSEDTSDTEIRSAGFELLEGMARFRY